jgi:hypothetical protein
MSAAATGLGRLNGPGPCPKIHGERENAVPSTGMPTGQLVDVLSDDRCGASLGAKRFGRIASPGRSSLVHPVFSSAVRRCTMVAVHYQMYDDRRTM